MKKLFLLVATALVMLGLPGTASAMGHIPVNDDFDSATVVTEPLPFSDFVPTHQATTAPDDPSCFGNRRTVWYRYTPSASGTINVNTFGSDYDTTLSAYTGQRGALTQLACNDDTSNLQSSITFPVTAGITYHLMAGTFAFSQPADNLSLTVQHAGQQPGPTVPDSPIIGSATPGFAEATVSFTPPADDGGSPITSYTAVSSPGGITASGPSSPITVSGLTNGTTYTFTVYATNAAGDGPPSAASNPVTPSSTPFFSVDDVSVVEGNSGTTAATFTISRFGNTSGSSSVKSKTTDGTATAPSDYAAAAPLLATSFAAGQTTKAVTVNVKGDAGAEPDETFDLVLYNPVGATIFDGTGTGTIVNDDSNAPSTFSIDDVAVTEGNSGTKVATLTITRSGSTAQSAAVKYKTADGTATAPSDYAAAAPLTGVSFPVGVTTKTVNVTVKGDVVPEPDETFDVNLYAPQGATITDGTGTVTIENDDSSATASLSVDDVSITEGNGLLHKTMTFTITRSGDISGASSVEVMTANGTAIAPGDYTAKALTTVSFAAGQTTKTVPVTIRGDSVPEPDEIFTLDLAEPVGAVIADGSGTGTIVNDD